jgi:hypothetical protein
MMTPGALNVGGEAEQAMTAMTSPVGCVTFKHITSRFVQKAYAPKVLYLIGTPFKMAVSPGRAGGGGF